MEVVRRTSQSESNKGALLTAIMQAKGHTKKVPAPQCSISPNRTTPGKGQAGQHTQGSSEPNTSSASASLWAPGQRDSQGKGTGGERCQVQVEQSASAKPLSKEVSAEEMPCQPHRKCPLPPAKRQVG